MGGMDVVGLGREDGRWEKGLMWCDCLMDGYIDTEEVVCLLLTRVRS